MRIVVLASRKGGSGKTTLAGHLAVQAEMSGAGPVALVDSDPQGSLADWWNLRAAAAPHFVQAGLDELPDALERLRAHGMALLIVDTPSALTTRVGNLIGLADLVVIPTRPSPHDLRSIGATVKLVEHLGKPLIFVVNAAPPRARITAEAISLVSQYGPLAPSILHQRVDFASSMIDGRTVMELPSASRSVSEIAQLWAYLESRLEQQPRTPGLPIVPGHAAPPMPLSALGATGA
ncbi:MAG: ParA family protein [Kiloniellales bacterium]|nr:ParA family protein [Kiloniellales bacterium]